MSTSLTNAPNRHTVVPLTETPAWAALEAHYERVSAVHLCELFASDPGRGERLTAEGAGLFLDYSKNRITDETVSLLIRLARESGLQSRIDAMFRGDKINTTEGRAVLHVALRVPRESSISVDGQNVVPEVHAVLDRMSGFADRVRTGGVEGLHGKADPQCDQHRHRRIRSGAGDGL